MGPWETFVRYFRLGHGADVVVVVARAGLTAFAVTHGRALVDELYIITAQEQHLQIQIWHYPQQNLYCIQYAIFLHAVARLLRAKSKL